MDTWRTFGIGFYFKRGDNGAEDVEVEKFILCFKCGGRMERDEKFVKLFKCSNPKCVNPIHETIIEKATELIKENLEGKRKCLKK